MRRGTPLAAAAAAVALALALFAPAAASAQDVGPRGRTDLPAWGGPGFDGVYPARLLSVEGGRLLEEGGIVGLGDTRWLVHPRVEVLTNTLSDILGIANAGAKVALARGEGPRPAVAVAARGYWSYGGLLDAGVRRVAESFADVTDSAVEVSGVVGYLTATWSANDDRTHLHASVETHQPFESTFRVEDSEAGGGGSVRFEQGDDVSAMWGVDHRLLGHAVVVVLEAGWSFGLEEARFGGGVDLGGERWRVLLGASYPGVETDLATEPRDFVVNPAFSLHYRF